MKTMNRCAVAALALNLAWEWIYAVRGLATGGDLHAWTSLVWGVLDVVIVVTYLRFGRAELPAFVTRAAFVVISMPCTWRPSTVVSSSSESSSESRSASSSGKVSCVPRAAADACLCPMPASALG